MSEALTTAGSLVPAATPEALETMARVEKKMRAMPQIHLHTEHVLHAGMYARTIHLAARVAITSVLIKIPTMIVVNGTCRVYAGDLWRDLDGFHVIPASAGRKMIYVTAKPTQITMIFPSHAKSVEEAERQFTDDAELLLSRSCKDDTITITGVQPGVEPCQA
jgi:hypothetical protein